MKFIISFIVALIIVMICSLFSTSYHYPEEDELDWKENNDHQQK